MSLISLVDSVDVKHHVYSPVYVRLCALVELPLIDDDGDDGFWFILDPSFIVHGSIRCRAHTLSEVFSEKVVGKLKTKTLPKDIKSEKRTNNRARTHARTHARTQPPPATGNVKARHFRAPESTSCCSGQQITSDRARE